MNLEKRIQQVLLYENVYNMSPQGVNIHEYYLLIQSDKRFMILDTSW